MSQGQEEPRTSALILYLVLSFPHIPRSTETCSFIDKANHDSRDLNGESVFC